MTSPSGPIGPDEDAFLQQHTRTFLLVSRGDGSPTAYAMVGLYRDGNMEFSTYRKSAKVKRMLRAPAVSCLVTAKDGDPDRRVLLVRGTAEIVDGAAVAPPAAQATTGATPAALRVDPSIAARAQARLESGKRCIVRVVPSQATFLPERRAPLAAEGGH